MKPATTKNDLIGIGFKNRYYERVVENNSEFGWLEIHPENYFGGGERLKQLEAISQKHSISMHAVGLSLGSTERVSAEHLSNLKNLVDRFNPIRVSDHASWSKNGNAHMGDLLPLPYTKESLDCLTANIKITQDFLGRQILIENPSTYLSFTHSEFTEPEFLNKAADLTGCGLLIDVNNIYVQAHNHGIDAKQYIDAINPALVQEIHLAGHISRDFNNGKLLIDTHSRTVCNEVWELYSYAISKFGAVPTLIEWDQDLPEFDTLVAEANKAAKIITNLGKRNAA